MVTSFGTVSTTGNSLLASLGGLAPGAVDVVTLQVLAIASGQMVNTASVSSDEFNTDNDGGTSQLISSIVESPGTVAFPVVSAFQVLQTAGTASLTVFRTWVGGDHHGQLSDRCGLGRRGARLRSRIRYIDLLPRLDFASLAGSCLERPP